MGKFSKFDTSTHNFKLNERICVLNLIIIFESPSIVAGVVVVEAVEDGVDHGRHVGEGVGEQLEEEHGRRDCVDVEYHAEEEEEVGGQPAEDEVECDECDELGHLFGLVVVAPLLLVQLALDREHVGGALAARRRRLFACSFEGFLCLAGYVQHGELL